MQERGGFRYLQKKSAELPENPPHGPVFISWTISFHIVETLAFSARLLADSKICELHIYPYVRTHEPGVCFRSRHLRCGVVGW